MSALDATGSVGEMPGWRSPVPSCNRFMRWEDLGPFTQGYIEALFASVCPEEDGSRPLRQPAFSDLAPEALARIIADCERYVSKFSPSPNISAGAGFWRDRQRIASHFVDGETCRSLQSMGFPPLTVQLGGDGKVRFAALTGETGGAL